MTGAFPNGPDILPRHVPASFEALSIGRDGGKPAQLARSVARTRMARAGCRVKRTG